MSSGFRAPDNLAIHYPDLHLLQLPVIASLLQRLMQVLTRTLVLFSASQRGRLVANVIHQWTESGTGRETMSVSRTNSSLCPTLFLDLWGLCLPRQNQFVENRITFVTKVELHYLGSTTPSERYVEGVNQS